MSKFPLIIFEGIECSGKSTQLKNVVIFLKKNKKKFLYLREPGGSNNSEKFRKLILNKKSNFNKFTDFLLCMASRSENMEKIIQAYSSDTVDCRILEIKLRGAGVGACARVRGSKT